MGTRRAGSSWETPWLTRFGWLNQPSLPAQPCAASSISPARPGCSCYLDPPNLPSSFLLARSAHSTACSIQPAQPARQPCELGDQPSLPSLAQPAQSARPAQAFPATSINPARSACPAGSIGRARLTRPGWLDQPSPPGSHWLTQPAQPVQLIPVGSIGKFHASCFSWLDQASPLGLLQT